MNNMLAETIVHIAEGWQHEFGVGTRVTFEMLVKPDVKHFRQGMPMDTLTVTFVNTRPAEVRPAGTMGRTLVTVNHKKVAANGVTIGSGSKELEWDGARHFLRALFTGQKLFDFKQHGPFYTVSHEDGRTQTV
jgi:hypothetical protein